jgi:hypothetical protein
MMFSNYGSLRFPVAAAAAGSAQISDLDGGSGSGNNGGRGGDGGGNRWWGEDGGFGRGGNGNGNNGPAALAAALGAAAVLAATHDAAPRRASAGGLLTGLVAWSALALPGLGAAAGTATSVAAAFGPAGDEVLPGPSRLTRREVMLYDPPQYRVRDNIYIH